MSPGRQGSVVAGILCALGVTISAGLAPVAVADERVSVNDQLGSQLREVRGGSDAAIAAARQADVTISRAGKVLVQVNVEGPADAIAVTRASHGRYVGVAPLGTNLTSEQATQLRGYGVDPIIATDADVAGQVAAQRNYWILTPQRLQPRYAALPYGSDPAELLATGSAPQLIDALDQARPLADVLIDERLTNLSALEAAPAATPVIAAQAVDAWEPAVHPAAQRTGVAADVIRSPVHPFIPPRHNHPTPPPLAVNPAPPFPPTTDPTPPPTCCRSPSHAEACPAIWGNGRITILSAFACVNPSPR